MKIFISSYSMENLFTILKLLVKLRKKCEFEKFLNYFLFSSSSKIKILNPPPCYNKQKKHHVRSLPLPTIHHGEPQQLATTTGCDVCQLLRQRATVCQWFNIISSRKFTNECRPSRQSQSSIRLSRCSDDVQRVTRRSYTNNVRCC